MDKSYDLDTSTESFARTQAEYERRSLAAAALPGARLDLAYGDDPAQRLDVFPAGPDAPVLVFYRGGYWKSGTKDARRFPALEWTPRGVSWITVGYRLLPGVTLAQTIEDACASLLYIAENAETLGIDASQIHVVGNSAGGHLCGMAVAADWPERPSVASFTGMSGLYDLAPLLAATPNTWLNLTSETAAALSPINHLPAPDLPVALCYGGNETSAFQHQSSLYAEACRANGNPVTLFECPGKDHFEIIGELGTPGTPLFAHLERLIA